MPPSQSDCMSWFAWDSLVDAYFFSIINGNSPLSLVWTIFYVFPSSPVCHRVFSPSPRLPLTFICLPL